MMPMPTVSLQSPKSMAGASGAAELSAQRRAGTTPLIPGASLRRLGRWRRHDGMPSGARDSGIKNVQGAPDVTWRPLVCSRRVGRIAGGSRPEQP
jgi:hypothetical protein